MKNTHKKNTQLCSIGQLSEEWDQLELLAKADGHASLKSAANDGALWGCTIEELTRLWKPSAKGGGQPREVKSMSEIYDILDAENDATKAEGRA